MIISHERLLEILQYNADAGEFVWKSTGAIAGHIRTDGYRRICIFRKYYYAGPLAHFYMTGSWSSKLIDHANGIRSDDRWQNLREATVSENAANKKISPRNKAAMKGVTAHKRRWKAEIKQNYKKTYLGIFRSKEEAHAAYARAAETMFGKFARFN